MSDYFKFEQDWQPSCSVRIKGAATSSCQRETLPASIVNCCVSRVNQHLNSLKSEIVEFIVEDYCFPKFPNYSFPSFLYRVRWSLYMPRMERSKILLFSALRLIFRGHEDRLCKKRRAAISLERVS